MKYPIFASVVVFALLLMYAIHKSRDGAARRFQAFLDREAEANNTRKKSLDDLHYITIPMETLPVQVLKEDARIAEILGILHELSERPIVNLTGITNTELKLKYGAPNIELLSRYDESYTILARTLDQWAHILYEKEYKDEAKAVLEFAVSTGTDVKTTYELLASIYISDGEDEKIKELIPQAEALQSLSRRAILEILEKPARHHAGI